MSDYNMEDWHWRNSMKVARFFIFDARAALVLVLVLVRMRLWTLILAILTFIVFWMLEKRGLTVPAALRALRVWLLGPKRPAIIWTSRRPLKDTGSK